jgi:hypothetical protein
MPNRRVIWNVLAKLTFSCDLRSPLELHRRVVLSKGKCLSETNLNSGTGWLRGSDYRISGRVVARQNQNLYGGGVSPILIRIGRA